MISYTERLKRADEFRKWYLNLPTPVIKSQQKRKIISSLMISEDCFYHLLRGRTYINPTKRQLIEQAVQTKIFE